MADLNESSEHTVASHSSHLELFLCDLKSVVPYLLPELKQNHQDKETSHKLLSLIACDLYSVLGKSNEN